MVQEKAGGLLGQGMATTKERATQGRASGTDPEMGQDKLSRAVTAIREGVASLPGQLQRIVKASIERPTQRYIECSHGVTPFQETAALGGPCRELGETRGQASVQLQVEKVLRDDLGAAADAVAPHQPASPCLP